MNIYGQIVTGVDVADATERTIKTWMPAYLAEACRQHNAKHAEDEEFEPLDLPAFNSYGRSLSKLDKFEEHQLPACVIVSPGINGKPTREGNGIWTATWGVGIGMYVAARDQESTMDNVQLYCAAVRTLVVQHRSLGGFARATAWLDEAYDLMKYNDSRTIQAAVVSLGVEVRGVVNSLAGPVDPPEDPSVDPGEWPRVEHTFIATRGLPS